MKCGVITKRISETVATRARDLKLEFVYMGQAFKMQAVREIMEKERCDSGRDRVCGRDDVIDLPVMRECGFAVAVANARPQVKAAAHYVTPNAGGYGAGRDAVEFILEAKGILDEIIEGISTNAIRFRHRWILARAASFARIARSVACIRLKARMASTMRLMSA